MIPNKQQEALLAHLSADPVWHSILDDLKASKGITPWKKGGDHVEKTARFVFESGELRENERIISILDVRKTDG